MGKRIKYLPATLTWTTEDDEEEVPVSEHTFTYTMDGDYITKMTIIEKGWEEKPITFQIFYED